MRLRKSLRGYGWATFVGDFFGGGIAALIALPYGLAIASLVGLPPILGLFTSLITSPFCVFLGRNPVLIGGTSSTTIPFIGAAVREQGIAGAAKVVIAAGVMLMVFSVLHLGRYVTKVQHSVLAGFSCGIGGMMIISQLKIMLGFSAPKGGWHEQMIPQLMQEIAKYGEVRAIPAILGITVVVIAAIAVKLLPKGPSPLFGVIIAVAMARMFGWNEKTVGALDLVLPPFAGFTWYPSDVWKMVPQAFGLAFVTAVNILITSRVVDHFRGRHKHMRAGDADAELGAYGIGNVVAGMFGAPMSVGIPARSIANVQCGGTTRMSNAIHGLILLAFLTIGSGVISRIPLAALAGVTIWMGARLLDWSTWKRLHKMRRVDAAAFLVTAVAVLLVNAVEAVAIGSALYIIPYLQEKFSKKDAAQPQPVEA